MFQFVIYRGCRYFSFKKLDGRLKKMLQCPKMTYCKIPHYIQSKQKTINPFLVENGGNINVHYQIPIFSGVVCRFTFPLSNSSAGQC